MRERKNENNEGKKKKNSIFFVPCILFCVRSSDQENNTTDLPHWNWVDNEWKIWIIFYLILSVKWCSGERNI